MSFRERDPKIRTLSVIGQNRLINVNECGFYEEYISITNFPD